MPFATLSANQQLFLQKYFKPKGFFSKGTSDKDKDKIADELLGWNVTLEQVNARIAALPSDKSVDTKPLKAISTAAVDMVSNDAKKLRLAESDRLLKTALPLIDKAETDFYTTKKNEAIANLATIKTLLGVALEVPKYQAKLDAIDTAWGKTPHDLAAIKTLASAVHQARRDLVSRSTAYKATFDKHTLALDTHAASVANGLGDDVVKPEREPIIALIALARTKLDEYSFDLADSLVIVVKQKVEAAGRIVAAKTAYGLIKTAADEAIAKLEKARNPGVDEECVRIAEIAAGAAKAGATRDFYTATLAMEPLPKRIDALLPVSKAHHNFAVAAKQASAAMVELRKHPQAAYVLPDQMVIQTHIDAAVALAGAGQFDRASNRLSMVDAMCKDAAAKAATAAPFDALAKDAATGDLSALLVQAKTLLAGLQKHPRVAEITQAVADVGGDVAALERAVVAKDDPAARSALQRVVDLATGARKLADIIDKIFAQADAIDERAKALAETHGFARYVAADLAKVTSATGAGRTAAKAGDEAGFTKLTEAEAAYEKARRLADAEENHRLRRAEVEAKVKLLAPRDYPDKIANDKAIADHLIKANEHSKAFDHLKAGGSLKAVEALLAVAKIGADAKGGNPPSADEIKALIALPDGERMLDKMIEALPASVQQAVAVDLLKARFNMDVKVFKKAKDREKGDVGAKTGVTLDSPDPNMLAYYKMLVAVPETHTKLNPSLKRFDQVEDDTGSYYDGAAGAVVMGCFKKTAKPNYALGDATELAATDPGCEPVPDSVDAPKPTWGKWAALHEIGHAVDDRKGFMASNGNKAEFGGWTNYGMNIEPVAKVVAAHFDYDLPYIEAVLAGGTPAIPEVTEAVVADKADKAQAVWDKRRTDFAAWFAGVRSTTDIWDNAAACTKWEIGGTMYHEAYPYRWVSYSMAARSKGVSGYQFRAPGEWFSELYAAYHAGKLKPTHPATKWLSTL